MRYLVELASQPEAKGIVLTGGFGMRVKQNDLKRRGVRTLIADLPEARATSDLDIILSLEFWLEPERGRNFRKLWCCNVQLAIQEGLRGFSGSICED